MMHRWGRGRALGGRDAYGSREMQEERDAIPSKKLCKDAQTLAQEGVIGSSIFSI